MPRATEETVALAVCVHAEIPDQGPNTSASQPIGGSRLSINSQVFEARSRENVPVTMTMTRPRRRLSLIVGGLAALLYAAVALFSGVGVWGADPYWYAGDLSMLRLTGEPRTNAIFSSTLLDPTISATNLPQWIHSIMYTHVASWLRPLSSDSYNALLIVNIAFALATAAVVLIIARKIHMSWPIVPAIAFLAFPATMTFTVNTYPEIALAFGVAITAYGALLAVDGLHPALGLAICGGGTIFLYYNRESFVLAAVAFIVFCLWATKMAGRFRFHKALPFQLGVLVAVAIKGWIFSTYPTAGLSTALMSRTSQNPSNMASYDSADAAPFDLGPFLDKVGFGLRHALLPSGGFELVIETAVLLIVGWAVWSLRHDATIWTLRFWGVVFLCIYLATEAFFQPGWRYLYSILPIACVFASICWESAMERATAPHRRRLVRDVGALTLAFMLASSLVIAMTYRSTAAKTEVQLESMTSAISQTEEAPILVVADRKQMMPLTYAAVPRPVLTVEEGFNSVEDATRLIDHWQPRVFVSGSAADLDLLETAVAQAYGTNVRLKQVATLDTPGGDAKMFTINLGSDS